MVVLVREKATGKVVEVFNLAPHDGVTYAGPPGKPEEGRVYLPEELEPDPVREVLRHGIHVPWWDRAEA